MFSTQVLRFESAGRETSFSRCREGAPGKGFGGAPQRSLEGLVEGLFPTPTNDVDRADPQDGIRNWGFWRIALAVSIALFWLWLIRVARRWWVRRRLLLTADDDDDEEEKEAN